MTSKISAVVNISSAYSQLLRELDLAHDKGFIPVLVYEEGMNSIFEAFDELHRAVKEHDPNPPF